MTLHVNVMKYSFEVLEPYSSIFPFLATSYFCSTTFILQLHLLVTLQIYFNNTSYKTNNYFVMI